MQLKGVAIWSIFCFLLALSAAIAMVRLNKRAQKYKKTLDEPESLVAFKTLRRKIRWHYLGWLAGTAGILTMGKLPQFPPSRLPAVFLGACFRYGYLCLFFEILLWLPRKKKPMAANPPQSTPAQPEKND